VQLMSGLRLVMLNTNLYYYNDEKMANRSDPAGQFAWLDSILKDAEENNDSVSVCHRFRYLMRTSFEFTHI